MHQMLNSGKRMKAQYGIIHIDKQHRANGYTGQSWNSSRYTNREYMSHFNNEKSEALVLPSSLSRNQNLYAAPSMLRNLIIIFIIIGILKVKISSGSDE